MGLGTLGGGVGTARFFAEQGANVTITDLKTEDELKTSLTALSKYDIKYVLGHHDEAIFESADLIIKNPSVPSSSPYLELARKKRIPIEMAESLFLKEARKRKIENIIGVTGTRGKSTTSAMIYEILQKAEKDVYLAGNQKDTSTLLLLNEIKENSIVILELSSWMLESFEWHDISPHVAVITNIYPDHLNRYESMGQYIQAKSNIFLFQNAHDHLVLNSENKQTKSFASKAKSQVHWFSSKSVPEEIAISLSGGGSRGHNRENAGAAYVVCSLLGIDEKVITMVLQNFTGLPGRLEHLGEINKRIVINDTTSTTPTSGIKALESIVPNQKIILIVGGNSKDLPIEDLVAAIKNRAKAIVYLTGNATSILQKEFEASDIPSAGPFNSMKDTVSSAFGFADPGDVILFSPSFTSFGQFKNEFERGEQFNHAVKTLDTSPE